MVLCIICFHISRLSACIEAWALIVIGRVLKRRIISRGCRGLSRRSPPLPPFALPSVVNLNCLLTKKSAAHFSTPLSLYRKVPREPSHACSILDDTLNPIWLEVHSVALLHSLLLIVCVIACVCACVCEQDCICMCKFVWARADVCHVFAVISFSCLVSQDSCYTVCSACQARLGLRSNSQRCATVGKK